MYLQLFFVLNWYSTLVINSLCNTLVNNYEKCKTYTSVGDFSTNTGENIQKLKHAWLQRLNG